MGNCCRRQKDEGSDNVNIKKAIESNKKLCIWVLGGPGSGKGTQCKTLSNRFMLANLSTGDLLRKLLNEDTHRGLHIRKAMGGGELVDTGIVLEMLTDSMKDACKDCNGFIIDGFPRNLEQGEQFCQQISKPHLIIYLECPDEVLVERLLSRGQQSGRIDDNAETIQRRLQTYHNISQPVIKNWADLVVNINGNQSPAEVGRECIAAVEKIQSDLKR